MRHMLARLDSTPTRTLTFDWHPNSGKRTPSAWSLNYRVLQNREHNGYGLLARSGGLIVH